MGYISRLYNLMVWGWFSGVYLKYGISEPGNLLKRGMLESELKTNRSLLSSIQRYAQKEYAEIVLLCGILTFHG